MAPNVYGIIYNRPCDKNGDKINSQQATNKSMAESASTSIIKKKWNETKENNINDERNNPPNNFLPTIPFKLKSYFEK